MHRGSPLPRHRVVARLLAVTSSASPVCSPSCMEGSYTMNVPRWKTPSFGAQRRRTLATTIRLATGDTALPTAHLQKLLDVPVEGTTLILTGPYPWAIWQQKGGWCIGQGWLGVRMPRREILVGKWVCHPSLPHLQRLSVAAHSSTTNGSWRRLTAIEEYTGRLWSSDSKVGLTWNQGVPRAGRQLLQLPIAQARWWNISNLSQPDPTARPSQSPCGHPTLLLHMIIINNKKSISWHLMLLPGHSTLRVWVGIIDKRKPSDGFNTLAKWDITNSSSHTI